MPSGLALTPTLRHGETKLQPVPWLRTETYDPQFKYDSALRVGKVRSEIFSV